MDYDKPHNILNHISQQNMDVARGRIVTHVSVGAPAQKLRKQMWNTKYVLADKWSKGGG